MLGLGTGLLFSSGPIRPAGLSDFDELIIDSDDVTLTNSSGVSLRWGLPASARYLRDSANRIITNSDGQAIVLPN